jgi:hypothetical protein
MWAELITQTEFAITANTMILLNSVFGLDSGIKDKGL